MTHILLTILAKSGTHIDGLMTHYNVKQQTIIKARAMSGSDQGWNDAESVTDVTCSFDLSSVNLLIG